MTKEKRPTATKSLEAYMLSVIRGRRGVVPLLLRGFLLLLALLHRVGLELYLLIYQVGLRRRTRLPRPVISVGNITAGGTGKTPTVHTLCRLLKEEGLQPAVLSRGYRGRFEHGSAIVSDGQKIRLSVQEAGDEAYLLARNLPGVPVVVGKDRRVTGALAIGQFQPDVLVLDDGMQFWQLHRDVEIVLVNALNPFDNGWIFPRGLLREPPSHLRRAHIILLTNAGRLTVAALEALRARIRRLAPGKPIFTADPVPGQLRFLADQVYVPAQWLAGRRVVAVSAIADPTLFESMIGELGGILAASFRFRDHHVYTPKEIEQVMEKACTVNAEAVITTEKDAVKLMPLRSARPLAALQVSMHIDAEHEFMTEVLKAVEEAQADRRW
ncbi:lipid-A-disaccharide kinase [Chthonomonas calidirosea]|uniref:tetraacyldisaccharide 4'-kinase n=1 Tax=Chthonomonas calidirosea TaxID=454171 RepID=UPI0006DD3DD7|nr:tetraacyldisaccharide 4'-kinase [Chthonomonas calidirosea]CEK18328.1 lipid-A-disaccharide kinase [Chthonomonas calidirosea]